MLKTKYIYFLVWIPTLVALDQYTKLYIIDHFSFQESLPVISGFFDITHVHNPGAAFGFMRDAHPSIRVPFFIMLPFIALGVLFAWLRTLPDSSKLLSTALGLICSGAIGNLIDRIRLGYVIDFLHFHWKYEASFPSFNVADSAITVGIVFMLIDQVLAPKRDAEQIEQLDSQKSKPNTNKSSDDRSLEKSKVKNPGKSNATYSI